MKKRSILIWGALVMLALGFITAGCSTFPTSKLIGRYTTYDVLGLVAGTFSSYEDALTAARRVYPNADAVIKIKATLDDSLFSQQSNIGYAAVKLTTADVPPAPPRKKFLGIF